MAMIRLPAFFLLIVAVLIAIGTAGYQFGQYGRFLLTLRGVGPDHFARIVLEAAIGAFFATAMLARQQRRKAHH